MSVIIQKPSPNFTKGRMGNKPELIIIHIMAGTLLGTDQWFGNTVSKVSSNYGIGVNGEIHQYVADEDTAYAQGLVDNPSWNYRLGVNPNLFCLSIEHEGMDLSKGPDLQIATSAQLVKELASKWGISLDRAHIRGHYEIRGSKPNCPATDKSIIDKIIMLAKGEVAPQFPVLRLGSKGDSVKQLQQKLNQKRGCNLGIDGIFEIQTFRQVLAFQADNKLVADGIVGPKTWAKLNS